jgi:hypothetical protein
MNDRRRLARLGHNLSWLWLGCCRRRSHDAGCCRRCNSSRCLLCRTYGNGTHDDGRGGRALRKLRLPLLFLLSRQDRLQHIARLGDVG